MQGLMSWCVQGEMSERERERDGVTVMHDKNTRQEHQQPPMYMSCTKHICSQDVVARCEWGHDG
jgi:hypothetical protein